MSEPKTLIYAELLSNIRQISVIAALHPPCDSSTKAELSADREQIILHHDGKVTALRLPGQVSSNAQLQKPALGNNEISWRLPLAGQSSRADVESLQNVEAPWPAKSFGDDAEFSCRECNTIIVKQGKIKTWKDLPSENWAEMMEFWHCHKPDDEPNGSSGHAGHNHAEDNIADRGYGASNKFLATPGIGFVDTTTFLLSNSDCSSIQSTLPPETLTKHQPVSCASCRNYIGQVDQHAEGIRLFKWRLHLTRSTTLPKSRWSISASQVLSSHLSSVIHSQCTSRLILLPLNWTPSSASSCNSSSGPSNSALSGTLLSSSTSSSRCSAHASTKDSNKSTLSTGLKEHSTPFSFMHLWVLTPSIKISATSSFKSLLSMSEPYSDDRTGDGQLAMKLFWKVVSPDEAAFLMDKEGVEEVALPAEVIIEMKDCLITSALLLPPSTRKFQEWDVGLLERFEDR